MSEGRGYGMGFGMGGVCMAAARLCNGLMMTAARARLCDSGGFCMAAHGATCSSRAAVHYSGPPAQQSGRGLGMGRGLAWKGGLVWE